LSAGIRKKTNKGKWRRRSGGRGFCKESKGFIREKIGDLGLLESGKEASKRSRLIIFVVLL